MTHQPVEYRGHHFLPSLLPANPVVVDLGSHKGEFAGLMHRDFAATGVSLEANPDLAEKLPQVSGFQFIHGAAAGCDGVLEFHLDSDNAESSTSASVKGTGRTVKVQSWSFPSIMQRTGSPVVHLVKMDIESAELDLIRETPVEDLKKVEQWTIEFHDFIRAEESESVQECLDRLRKAGFEIFRFCLTGHKDILAVRSDLINARGISVSGLKLMARFCALRRMILSRVFNRPTGK